MCKLTKSIEKFHISAQIRQGNALFSEKNYTAGKKIHTTAGCDGRDKFQVCASMHGANLSSGLRQLSGEAIVAG